MAVFLFRADASAEIGAGHAMRCLAIAEALADQGHECHFAMAETVAPITRRLDSEGMKLHRVDGSANAFIGLANQIGAAALIVDGYHFDVGWRRAIRRPGRPVLAFDDHGGVIPLYADLVVNAAADADPAAAHGLLLGPDYFLLRRELRLALARPALDPARRDAILIGFGGTDPAGLTVPVAEAVMSRLPSDAAIDVVIGGGVRDAATVADHVKALGGRVRAHLDPPEMGELMRGAGLAISAAGGMLGELAAFGVPAVIAIIADNQRIGGERAVTAGWAEMVDAGIPGGPAALAGAAAALWADPPRRARMAACAAGLIDGCGAARVAMALIEWSAKV